MRTLPHFSILLEGLSWKGCIVILLDSIVSDHIDTPAPTWGQLQLYSRSKPLIALQHFMMNCLKILFQRAIPFLMLQAWFCVFVHNLSNNFPTELLCSVVLLSQVLKIKVSTESSKELDLLISLQNRRDRNGKFYSKLLQ